MFTYADASVCPCCRVSYPPGPRPERCGWCAVPLEDPLTHELLATLQRADHLVADLYAQDAPTALLPGLPPPPPLHAGAPSGHVGQAGFTTLPPPPPPGAPARSGVRTASVPAVLLSLGALCLLVAAVAFLAVAWSWLGVGGRTAVLLGLTVAAAAGGAAFAHRRLRAAAESLTVVGAGLWLLDVVGADRAGWLGDLDSSALALACGLALAAYGVITAGVSRRLAAPQVLVPVSLLVSFVALADVVDQPLLVAALSVPVLALLAAAGRRAGLVVAAWSGGAAAGCAWVWLSGLTLARVDDLRELSWSSVWLGGPGWALAVLVACLLLPLLVAPRLHLLTSLCVAATACAGTGVVLLPAADSTATGATIALLAASSAWLLTSQTLQVRRSWLALPTAAPAVLSTVPLAVVALSLLAGAGDRAITTTGSTLAPLDATPHPLVLLPCVLVALAAAHLVTILARPSQEARTWLILGAGAVTTAGIATVASYPVPVWAVVILLVAAALVAALTTLRRSEPDGLVVWAVAVVTLLGALAVAAPVASQLTVVTGALTLLAFAAVAGGRFPAAAAVGDVLLPCAAAGLLASVASLSEVPASHVGVPILVLVGAMAIVRPHVVLESSAAAVALVAGPLAVLAATDQATSSAVHLTVAGALITLSALVHPDRRRLALLGGALLLLATWVRLADLGVTAPEAYTLPAAVVLLLAGVVRLRQDSSATSALALTPGLTLATVPSLLWVLVGDPISWRALLLGLACLALVLAGARLRWSSPLLVGAVVLAALTLAELAPYVAQTPQWVALGSAGALLTVVGVTWERRLANLRHASARLVRLR